MGEQPGEGGGAEFSPVVIPGAGIWSVAHVKPRMEKRLDDELNHLGITRYLPLLRRRSRAMGYLHDVAIPMFDGYLFFAGGADERYKVITSGRVVRIIDVVNQARFIREISAIEAALAVDQKLSLFRGVHVGAHCRVMRGPMMGVEGILQKIDDRRCRVILRVSILGQAVEVNTAVDDVEPVL